MLRVRVQSSSDRELQASCTIKTLAQLQTEISDAIKQRTDSSAIVTVRFYKGSLIAIIAIAGVAVSIISRVLPYISDDLINIFRRAFRSITGLTVNIDKKVVQNALGFLGDILAIASKIFSFFGGGPPPLPPGFDPNGWEPI
jgi:hypothetical protein